MRTKISAYLDLVILGIIYLTVGLIPLFFLDVTTEYFEIPKTILLVGSVLLLVVLWSLSWVIKGKVVVTRTPLDIPLLLLLAVVLISSYISDSRYVSIFGNFPRVHGSAINWVAYILFYFVLVSNIRKAAQVRILYYVLLGSTVLTSLVSLLSYFGLYLPYAFAKSANFTLSGSSFSTTALVALLLPLPLLSIIHPNRFMPRIAGLILATFFGIVIALIGNLATQAAAIGSVLLTLLISRQTDLKKSLPLLMVPVIVSAVFLALSFIPLGQANPFQQKRVNFPREVQSSFPTSWKVSISSFRDKPFFGTGPGTYLFNFTQYKPVEHNSGRFWNINFDTSFNEFFQVLATLGGLGLMAFLLLTAMIISIGWRGLSRAGSQDNILALSLSASSLIVVLLLAFHVLTLVSAVAIMVLLAMLMTVHRHVTGKVEELSIGIKASKMSDSNLVVGDLLPLALFIPILIAVALGVWNMTKIVSADVLHRKALNAASNRGLDTYNNLVQAERLNPYIALYRTDLAQTNFALANAIAAQKGPTEASPGGSLTDSDRNTIRQLLAQSIREAQAATVLAPRSSQNWEILASIYRQISGVAQNALVFSLDSYGKAIQRDPLNPLLRVNVGGVYYSVRNHDLAIRFFSDAANLKPDYGNAYYNLSVALRDKGDLRSAQAAAERVLAIVDPKSADYKVASDYLADIRAKAATNSATPAKDVAGAQTQQQVPPAAQQQSALQEEGLPNVLDEELGNQPNVATPAAVKTPAPAAR